MRKMIDPGSEEETRILNELVKQIFAELGIPAQRWQEASDDQAQEVLEILMSRCQSVGIDAFSVLRQSLLDDAEKYRQQDMNEEAERSERLASIPRSTN